jgi:hypothetical protein
MLGRFVVALFVVIPLLVGSHRVGAQSGVQRHTRFVLVYGYLRDRHPDTDSTLDVWSKTHKLTYHVSISNSTVVKMHTSVVPRSRLTYNTYVIVTCNKGKNGSLEAVTVHIETPRHSKSKSGA